MASSAGPANSVNPEIKDYFMNLGAAKPADHPNPECKTDPAHSYTYNRNEGKFLTEEQVERAMKKYDAGDQTLNIKYAVFPVDGPEEYMFFYKPLSTPAVHANDPDCKIYGFANIACAGSHKEMVHKKRAVLEQIHSGDPYVIVRAGTWFPICSDPMMFSQKTTQYFADVIDRSIDAELEEMKKEEEKAKREAEKLQRDPEANLKVQDHTMDRYITAKMRIEQNTGMMEKFKDNLRRALESFQKAQATVKELDEKDPSLKDRWIGVCEKVCRETGVPVPERLIQMKKEQDAARAKEAPKEAAN